MLRAAGAEKINFAGGEPTLHRGLGALVREAKSVGFTTSLVTNGSRLSNLLESHGDALDWVGLSVDSGDERTQLALGRGDGRYVARAIRLAEEARLVGVRIKLNTVVTAMNWAEDLHGLVRAMQPERWKVFQVLRVVGQNDGSVEPLLITREMFDAFLLRHRDLQPIAESNEAMLDSYAMIDPLGRFYGDTGGVHRVSEPILEVGVEAALASVGFDSRKLAARGGLYSWGPRVRRLPLLSTPAR